MMFYGAFPFHFSCRVCYIGRKGKERTMKSTEQGYVNQNDQRNAGCTQEPGTDYGQKFYRMTCLRCGHHYFANGTDIWLRKCPKCQGGKP